MARLDAVVVGSGPAGLEAALNLKIREKDFMLFGSRQLSQKVEKAPRIDNYLGLPGISGRELKERYLAHMEQMGIALAAEQVSTVYPMGDYFAIATNHNTYEATAVILATGAYSAKTLPGEAEFLGRGVGYCATCDAPLYRGKTVAVIGYSDEAVSEANFISGIVGKLYYIPQKKVAEKLTGQAEVVSGKILEISGDQKVDALKLEGRTLAVDGVFVLRPTIAPASLVPGIAVKDGFISVDTGMRTSIPGCFAAGDCTGKPHQYMRAAGQGQTAALNAVEYIDQKRGKAGV